MPSNPEDTANVITLRMPHEATSAFSLRELLMKNHFWENLEPMRKGPPGRQIWSEGRVSFDYFAEARSIKNELPDL